MSIRLQTLMTGSRPVMAGAALALVLVAPAVSAEPIREFFVQSDDDRIVRSGDIVRIGSGVTVDEDEVVMGDVVSIFGSARVDGQVTGEVVVVFGDLTLGRNARVNDVVIVGGQLRRRPGARVRGDLNEIGFGRLGRDWFDWDDWGGRGRFRRGFGGGLGVGWTIFRLLFLSALVMAVVFVAPATVRRVGGTALESPWKAGLIGFAVQVFFLPVLVVTTVLLAVSIIGIPLLLLMPFLVLGLIILTVVGFTGVAYEIGRGLKARGGSDSGNMFLMALMGVLAIVAVALVGRGVALGGGLFSFFAAILLGCAFLIEYAAWTVGIGATALAGFGGKQYMSPPSQPEPGLPPSASPPPSAPPVAPPPTPSDTLSGAAPEAPPPPLAGPPPTAEPPAAEPPASTPEQPIEGSTDPASELRIVDLEEPQAEEGPRPGEDPRTESS